MIYFVLIFVETEITMNITKVLCLLVIVDACYARTMQQAPLKKRFNEAKYAFKFRVTSKATKLCVIITAPTTDEASTASTTTDATTATTMITTTTTTAAATKTATSARPSNKEDTTATTALPSGTDTTTTQRTTASRKLHTTQRLATSTITTKSATKQTKDTTTSSTNASILISSTTKSANEENDLNSTKTSPTTTAVSEESYENTDDESATTNATLESFTETTERVYDNNYGKTTKTMAPARKRRSCDMVVFHQDIEFQNRKIFKGCDEIGRMRWITGSNDIYSGAIRLQMGFGELTPKKNYLFLGRAVPGQNPEDYIFMADEFTVVPWKFGAAKLKKHFKTARKYC